MAQAAVRLHNEARRAVSSCGDPGILTDLLCDSSADCG